MWKKLAVGLLLVVAGCATTGTEEGTLEKASVDPTHVAFSVVNQSWETVNVDIYKRGSKVRTISQVTTNGSAVECVSAGLVSEGSFVRLVIDPIGGTKQIVRQLHERLKAGMVVELTAREPLHLSAITDVRNMGNVSVFC